MVLRPRLLEVLRQRWERRVTGVVGGAGAGKSTLLAQAVAENALDPRGVDAWVRCTPDDSAASSLGSAVCAALGVPDPAEPHLDAVARAVAEAVLGQAPVDVAIVLDDVHLVAERSEGAELLRRLAADLPANGHLVLAGRHKPPLPLARLVALGDAVVVGEDALTFTGDELAAFADLRGLDVDTTAQLAPWPAIAELMASAGPAVVRDYLWEEVLDALGPQRRHHLAVLAAAGGGDRELLRIATGEDVDLFDLVSDVPLATMTDAGWVELHALWDEPLAEHLASAERDRVRRRVADHLLARGDRERALPLLVAADAHDRIAELVVEVATHVYLPVAPDVLAGWRVVLDRVATTEGLPLRDLLDGLLAKEQAGELGDAKQRLTAAEAAFAGAGHASGELACLVHLFSIGFSLDDADLLAHTIERATALAGSGHAPAAPIAAIGQAGVADFFGDFAGALALLDDAPVPESSDWDAIRRWMRAELLESLGHPLAALETLDRARTGGGLIQDQLDGARVQALWSAGRVDEALASGAPALARARTSGSARTTQRGHALAARYTAYLGRVDEADEHLRDVDRHPPADRLIARRRHIARAARFVLAGDEAAAAAELAFLGPGPDLDPFLTAQKTVLRVLPLVYVLVPASRAVWDEADLGPTFATWRTLAAAFVARREGDDRPLRALPPIDPATVRSAFPLPWAVELAVGLDEVGRSDGRELFAALGAAAHPHLEALDRLGPNRAAARRLLVAVPSPPDGPVEIRLLGPPEPRPAGSDTDPPAWRRTRVRELLAHLVLAPSPTRDTVAAALWPDLDVDAAANNLRGTLSHLLGALQPDRGRTPSYFVRQGGPLLALVGHDRLDVDVWRFEAHVPAADAAERDGLPSNALDSLREAVALWRGPFAGGAPWAWVEAEADRLTTRYVTAAVRAAELTLAGGEPSEAERLADLASATDPWSERAHRVLAAAQLERGDRDAARRTLDRCRKVLAELGVEPEPATRMLERRLALGRESTEGEANHQSGMQSPLTAPEARPPHEAP